MPGLNIGDKTYTKQMIGASATYYTLTGAMDALLALPVIHENQAGFVDGKRAAVALEGQTLYLETLTDAEKSITAMGVKNLTSSIYLTATDGVSHLGMVVNDLRPLNLEEWFAKFSSQAGVTVRLIGGMGDSRKQPGSADLLGHILTSLINASESVSVTIKDQRVQHHNCLDLGDFFLQENQLPPKALQYMLRDRVLPLANATYREMYRNSLPVDLIDRCTPEHFVQRKTLSDSAKQLGKVLMCKNGIPRDNEINRFIETLKTTLSSAQFQTSLEELFSFEGYVFLKSPRDSFYDVPNRPLVSMDDLLGVQPDLKHFVIDLRTGELHRISALLVDTKIWEAAVQRPHFIQAPSAVSQTQHDEMHNQPGNPRINRQ